MSGEDEEISAQSTKDEIGIDPAIADEGAALLFTAIGELAEEASADAVMMRKDGQTVWVMRAERLQAFGVDVAALAKAIEVLGRRRDHPASLRHAPPVVYLARSAGSRSWGA